MGFSGRGHAVVKDGLSLMKALRLVNRLTADPRLLTTAVKYMCSYGYPMISPDKRSRHYVAI